MTAVLRKVVAYLIFAALANQATGEISNALQTLNTNPHLASIGRDNGFERFINKNTSQQGAVSVKTMATTVEAIIGAIYVDSKSLAAAKTTLAILGWY
jgi:ribonuclease-3